MKFEEALKAMREGKKSKLGNYIFYIEENTVWKHRIDDDFKLLGHLSYKEFLSEDWEIVDDNT